MRPGLASNGCSQPKRPAQNGPCLFTPQINSGHTQESKPLCSGTSLVRSPPHLKFDFKSISSEDFF